MFTLYYNSYISDSILATVFIFGMMVHLCMVYINYIQRHINTVIIIIKSGSSANGICCDAPTSVLTWKLHTASFVTCVASGLLDAGLPSRPPLLFCRSFFYFYFESTVELS